MDALINYYINKFGDGFRSHLLKWGEVDSLTESNLIEALVLWQGWDIESEVNISACNEIILAVNEKINISWDINSLSFVDKIFILKKLTQQGFNVLYANIIPYPTNTVEFKQILTNHSFFTQFKLKFNKKFNEYYHYRYNHTIWRVLTIIAVVGGLYYFDHNLLIASLIFSYFIWLLTFLHDHESMVHRYITPRNKFIDTVLRILCYIWGSHGLAADNPPDDETYNSHIHHHIYWKDTIKDPYQYEVNLGIFRYFFAIPSEEKNSYHEKITVSSFLMTKYLILLFYIMLLALGGLKIFFYFYVLPKVIICIFPEILHVLQHKFTKSADDEFDFIWLIPIFGVLGNHITHHINDSNQAFYGTKKYPWLKWANIHFYVVKLLYKDN